jgi:hypothetical protein
MNAEIYTKEEMLAAYIGSPDDRDFIKVHQFLRRLYANNTELKWVLVVGDGDNIRFMMTTRKAWLGQRIANVINLGQKQSVNVINLATL